MDDLTAHEVSEWAYECARLDLMARMPSVPTHRPILFDPVPKGTAKEEKKRLAALEKAHKAQLKAEEKEEKKRIAAWEKAYKTSQRYAAAQAKKAAKAK